MKPSGRRVGAGERQSMTDLHNGRTARTRVDSHDRSAMFQRGRSAVNHVTCPERGSFNFASIAFIV
jgi:hypothetical protein